MKANVSMRVTPGSDTLWSVHSGQRRWTSRLASSTRSWNRRSSRSGTGSAISRTRLSCGERDRSSVVASVFGDRVEGEDEVAFVVLALDLVFDVDVERGLVGRVHGD